MRLPKQPLIKILSLFIMASVFLCNIVYFNHFSSSILFWDQWDYYGSLFQGKGLFGIFFHQHGPHRQGLGNVLLSLLAFFTHWNSHAESFLIIILNLISFGLALALKHRWKKEWDLWDLLLPFLFFRINFFESISVVPNPSHGALPVLLLFLTAHIFLIQNLLIRGALLALISFFLANTGFGIIAAVLIAGTTWLWAFQSFFYKQKTCLLHASVALLTTLTTLTFLIDYTYGQSASGCQNETAPTNLFAYFIYFGLLLAHFFGLTKSILNVLIGLIFLSFCIILLLADVRKIGFKILDSKNQPAQPCLSKCLLVAYSLAFGFACCFGRLCQGYEVALSSRYGIHFIPLVFTTLTLCSGYGKANQFFRRSSFRVGSLDLNFYKLFQVAFAVLIIFGAFRLSTAEKAWFKRYAGGKFAWAECYVIKKNIDTCDRQTQFKVYPSAEGTHLKEKLDFLEKNRLNIFRN